MGTSKDGVFGRHPGRRYIIEVTVIERRAVPLGVRSFDEFKVRNICDKGAVYVEGVFDQRRGVLIYFEHPRFLAGLGIDRSVRLQTVAGECFHLGIDQRKRQEERGVDGT